jgi:hypothetical protein
MSTVTSTPAMAAPPPAATAPASNPQGAGDTRTNVISGGLLTYLYSAEEGKKIAAKQGADGKPIVQFFKDGQYQSGPDAATPESIKQVKITIDGKDHYFKQVASADGKNGTGFKATAWIETDAAGKPLSKDCELTLCYGGYTGAVAPLLNPNFVPSTPDEKAILAVKNGQINPQLADVRSFVDRAMASASNEGTVARVHNVGHSNGAVLAALSNAYTANGRPSDALLLEPFQAAKQVNQIAATYNVSPEALAANTTTMFAARNGQRNSLASMVMGNGIGEQRLVNMDANQPVQGGAIDQAMADHNLANIATATNNAGRTQPVIQQAPSTNLGAGLGSDMGIGELIMSLLMSLLSGGGMGMMMGGPAQNGAQQQSQQQTQAPSNQNLGQLAPTAIATAQRPPQQPQSQMGGR